MQIPQGQWQEICEQIGFEIESELDRIFVLAQLVLHGVDIVELFEDLEACNPRVIYLGLTTK